jgi:hypothetical protein
MKGAMGVRCPMRYYWTGEVRSAQFKIEPKLIKRKELACGTINRLSVATPGCNGDLSH